MICQCCQKTIEFLPRTFTSNSFQKDQFRFGLEYAFRDLVMLRGGYVYQEELLTVRTKQLCLAHVLDCL